MLKNLWRGSSSLQLGGLTPSKPHQHFALLNQRCVRWFGHHDQTDEPWTYPKELMYGELAVGMRPVGRPRLPFKDLCKGDLKLSGIGITN